MGAELRIFEEGIDIWRAMAERWRTAAAEAIAARGCFTVALSGGRTPVGFYCYLSRQNGLPWKDTEIFLVDERFVPPSDEENNMRLIRTSLLAGMPVLPKGVRGVVTDGTATPDEAARRYEDELRRFFKDAKGAFPAFDLVILGIGEDGHTASLFPGGEELKEQERWVVSSRGPAEPRDRITLTLPVLRAAKNVVFLATGGKKTEVLRRIWDRKQESGLPASLVNPRSGGLSFFVDAGAGAGLDGDLRPAIPNGC